MNIIARRNGGRGALIPYYSPMSLLGEVEELANELWDSWRPFGPGFSLVPETDIYEEKGNLIMKTELPGIKKEDLDITLEGDRLTIKAEKKEETPEGASSHARERFYGRYCRSLTLPFPINGDRVSATLENGVLELKIPRAKEAKARRIEVKAQLPQVKAKKRQKKSRAKAS